MITNYSHFFHAYDIRGLISEGLDSEFFYKLGKGFVTYSQAQRIAIGYDIRPESYEFQQAFIKGAVELGCDVIDIGMVATEMLYFVVGSDLTLDGGVTITASHNPEGWNGCKMVGPSARAIGIGFGLEQIENIVNTEAFASFAEQKGKIIKKNIYPEFKRKVKSFITVDKLKDMRIVVDAGNGIGGIIFDYVFGDLLSLQVTKMYFEPDGRFPNHVPDPLKLENIKELMERVVADNADLGIAIDGDADRVFFVDSKGRNPSGAFTGSIFIQHLLSKYPGELILHEPRLTRAIKNSIKTAGGKMLEVKAGHSFIKREMKERNALFTAEMSSHFFYRDFYYADSGMVTIALMFDMLTNGLDFDAALDKLFSKYPNSGEVNYQIKNKEVLFEQLKTKYHDGVLTQTDGISIDYPNWRFNLRGSNTQSLVRLNVEADTKELVVKKFKEIEALISVARENDPALDELRM